jgi:hypothetical protein
VVLLRPTSLARFVDMLATHADSWPENWADCRPMMAYLARHGPWHLAVARQVPEAVAFLTRLGKLAEREQLLTPEQESATRLDGLLALGLCPRARAHELPGPDVVALLVTTPDQAAVRPGAALLARRSLSELEEAFRDAPNVSAAVLYVVAEEIARHVLAEDDRPRWEALRAMARELESPIQYLALYAFKYVAAARPGWLSQDALEPFATGGPYDRLAATTLLLYLALQGERFPSAFEVRAFWQPRWEYNRKELRLLRGAMRFRGLPIPEAAKGDDDLSLFRAIESRRLQVLESLPPGEERLREILEGYWSLVARLPELGPVGGSMSQGPHAEDVLWLLIVSPYWEVSEMASGVMARLAAVEERWERLLHLWATQPDDATWWGALVGLRLLAERTGRDTSLFEAVRVQSRSPSAQLRGNCANALNSLIGAAPPLRQTELLEAALPELRLLLHGSDVWEANEVLMLLESLGERREAWAVRLDADDAPLLRWTPEWRHLSAAGWGHVVTERCTAAEEG